MQYDFHIIAEDHSPTGDFPPEELESFGLQLLKGALAHLMKEELHFHVTEIEIKAICEHTWYKDHCMKCDETREYP